MSISPLFIAPKPSCIISQPFQVSSQPFSVILAAETPDFYPSQPGIPLVVRSFIVCPTLVVTLPSIYCLTSLYTSSFIHFRIGDIGDIDDDFSLSILSFLSICPFQFLSWHSDTLITPPPCIVLVLYLYPTCIVTWSFSLSSIYTYKKRRPRAVYLQSEAFALPSKSNKQQETYADMTILLPVYSKEGYIVIPDRHLLLTLV